MSNLNENEPLNLNYSFHRQWVGFAEKMQE